MNTSVWSELRRREPCLAAALEIAKHHGGDGWFAYECFKDILRMFRLVGAGADNPALATTWAYEAAIAYAESVLIPPEEAVS